MIQTLESKNRILKNNIYDKKILSLIRDPIIDYDKINLLKKEKIEPKFSGKKFFVSIGRLTHQKNFLFLTRCLRKIIKREKKFIFLILGKGQDREKIESYIKKNKLTKYIFLLGYKKNIFKYINNSVGLICTSLWEEPGFVIQEAAACKKIILTSNCYSGPSEFLNHGKNGYVFKNNNKESFIKNFQKLLKEKKHHKNKIIENFKKTKFYTPIYFNSQIDKILN